MASRVGKNSELIGVDISETVVQAARERTEHTPNIRFETDDVMDLEFSDDSFDAAQAERTLCHSDDPKQALSEMMRVTRPGGRIGITDIDLGSHIMDTPSGHSVEDLLPEYALHKHPLIGRRMYRLMQETGLVDLDVRLPGVYDLEFDFLNRVIKYDERLDGMVEADEISRSAADEWLEAAQAASDQGQFFNGGLGVTVVGTVPAEE